MNAHTRITHGETRISSNRARLIAVLAIALGVHSGQTLAAGTTTDSYDENVLFNPSEAVLQAEARGRVTIYDGLEDKVVEQALDTQFERIDHMMFVRTRETLPDGSIEFEDDCD